MPIQQQHAVNCCTRCGASVEWRIPEGDSRPRHVCPQCGEIQYLNPKLVAGCIAELNGQVLLCRRAIEPRMGFWTLPAGFMENGESVPQAAARETLEEACAHVRIEQLFALVSLPRISQIHLFYRAQLEGDDIGAGTESLECRLFSEEEIPWDDLAFRSVALCLRAYFADLRAGCFQVHDATLDPMDEPLNLHAPD